MKVLIVDDNKALRDFLRLWAVEQTPSDIPDVFEAATLSDALRILNGDTIDAVLSGDAFPPDWGDRMGGPSEWWESAITLRRECLTRDVPFVLLHSHPLGKLMLARGAIEQVLALASSHQMAGTK